MNTNPHNSDTLPRSGFIDHRHTSTFPRKGKTNPRTMVRLPRSGGSLTLCGDQ
jgi:hypothetical protein